MSIARLVPDHLLITGKTSKCSCGQTFSRLTPDDDHLKHVLEMVWAEGVIACIDFYNDGTATEINNPYTEES